MIRFWLSSELFLQNQNFSVTFFGVLQQISWRLQSGEKYCCPLEATLSRLVSLTSEQRGNSSTTFILREKGDA